LCYYYTSLKQASEIMKMNLIPASLDAQGIIVSLNGPMDIGENDPSLAFIGPLAQSWEAVICLSIPSKHLYRLPPTFGLLAHMQLRLLPGDILHSMGTFIPPKRVVNSHGSLLATHLNLQKLYLLPSSRSIDMIAMNKGNGSPSSSSSSLKKSSSKIFSNIIQRMTDKNNKNKDDDEDDSQKKRMEEGHGTVKLNTPFPFKPIKTEENLTTTTQTTTHRLSLQSATPQKKVSPLFSHSVSLDATSSPQHSQMNKDEKKENENKEDMNTNILNQFLQHNSLKHHQSMKSIFEERKEQLETNLYLNLECVALRAFQMKPLEQCYATHIQLSEIMTVPKRNYDPNTIEYIKPKSLLDYAIKMEELISHCDDTIPLYHYTNTLAAPFILDKGLKMSNTQQGDGGVFFSSLGPASYGLGTIYYESNIIIDCYGKEFIEEYENKHKFDVVIVYEINPKLIEPVPGGKRNSFMISKQLFHTFSKMTATGQYYLRPDFILGAFLLDKSFNQKSLSTLVEAKHALQEAKNRDSESRTKAEVLISGGTVVLPKKTFKSMVKKASLNHKLDLLMAKTRSESKEEANNKSKITTETSPSLSSLSSSKAFKKMLSIESNDSDSDNAEDMIEKREMTKITSLAKLFNDKNDNKNDDKNDASKPSSNKSSKKRHTSKVSSLTGKSSQETHHKRSHHKRSHHNSNEEHHDREKDLGTKSIVSNGVTSSETAVTPNKGKEEGKEEEEEEADVRRLKESEEEPQPKQHRSKKTKRSNSRNKKTSNKDDHRASSHKRKSSSHSKRKTYPVDEKDI